MNYTKGTITDKNFRLNSPNIIIKQSEIFGDE